MAEKRIKTASEIHPAHIEGKEVIGWSIRNYIFKKEDNKYFFVVTPQLSAKTGRIEDRPPGGNRNNEKRNDHTPEDTLLGETVEETGLTVMSHKLLKSFTVPDDKVQGMFYGRFHYLTTLWAGDLLTFTGYNKSEDKDDTAPPAWIEAQKWAQSIPSGHMNFFKMAMEEICVVDKEAAFDNYLLEAMKILQKRIDDKAYNYAKKKTNLYDL
jgi:ADP-ribose pyrophosphatase YjhB (NUDIX family)